MGLVFTAFFNNDNFIVSLYKDGIEISSLYISKIDNFVIKLSNGNLINISNDKLEYNSLNKINSSKVKLKVFPLNIEDQYITILYKMEGSNIYFNSNKELIYSYG